MGWTYNLAIILNIDAIQELNDEIQENQQEMKERNDFFASAIDEDKADLLAELDGLEAEEFE